MLSPEAAARQRVELPWNDEVEQARKAEAALADERAAAERRAANLTAADEAALGSDVLGSRAYAEELADREAEEAAAQAAEAEAAEAEAMETPEPELDEYGIAIEDNDQQATPAQDAAEANVSAPAEPALPAFSRSAAARAAFRSPLPGSAAGTLPALLPISSRAPSTLLPKTAMRLASRPTRSPSASQTW